MQPVPFADAFDQAVLLLLEVVDRGHRLPQVVLRADRLPHAPLREFDHRGVQQGAVEPELRRV